MRSTITGATRRGHVWRTTAVAIGIIAAVATSTTAASATDHTATAKPRSVVQPNGVGYANSVSAATVLRANPTNSTASVGTAHPGDNIADICWMSGSGGVWDLVLERTGAGGDHLSNTAAFLPESSLSDGGRNQVTSCDSLNDSGHKTYVNHQPATLYSAAWWSAPSVGNGYISDVMDTMCWIQSGDGSLWNLVLDRDGRGGDHLPNLAAFIPESSLAGVQLFACGQS